MQHSAFIGENRINVSQAKKGEDYRCPECDEIVRLRGGIYRKNHFYHIRTNPSCRQSGKTIAHLQIQEFIHSLYPNGEATLEKKMGEIGRIADVVWEKEKIVFEIQCSNISIEEVMERCKDYEKAGYSIAWVLYDKKYNQRRLTRAEWYLRSRAAYYSSGPGSLYDQTEEVANGIRISQSLKFPINPRNPEKKKNLFHFRGDRFDRQQPQLRKKTFIGLYRAVLGYLGKQVSS